MESTAKRLKQDAATAGPNVWLPQLNEVSSKTKALIEDPSIGKYWWDKNSSIGIANERGNLEITDMMLSSVAGLNQRFTNSDALPWKGLENFLIDSQLSNSNALPTAPLTNGDAHPVNIPKSKPTIVLAILNNNSTQL